MNLVRRNCELDFNQIQLIICLDYLNICFKFTFKLNDYIGVHYIPTFFFFLRFINSIKNIFGEDRLVKFIIFGFMVGCVRMLWNNIFVYRSF